MFADMKCYNSRFPTSTTNYFYFFDPAGIRFYFIKIMVVLIAFVLYRKATATELSALTVNRQL